MVAEVVRLLGYTKNARILTNPATEILNGVARWGCHASITQKRAVDEDAGKNAHHLKTQHLVVGGGN